MSENFKLSREDVNKIEPLIRVELGLPTPNVWKSDFAHIQKNA